MAAGRFVSYLRVSTPRQGRSGLGLEAQRQAVADFLNGGDWRLVAEHVEVESGKRSDRPELMKALAACRRHQATLVVAKLDRLSRNAAFLLTLRDAGIEFVAVDVPGANRLTIGVLAVVAEAEREAISSRTKAALAAAKAKGKKLGNPAHLTDDARRLGRLASAKSRRALAARRAQDIAPIIAELRKNGVTSLAKLAAALNEKGEPGLRGGQWTAARVQHVLKQLAGVRPGDARAPEPHRRDGGQRAG